MEKATIEVPLTPENIAKLTAQPRVRMMVILKILNQLGPVLACHEDTLALLKACMEAEQKDPSRIIEEKQARVGNAMLTVFIEAVEKIAAIKRENPEAIEEAKKTVAEGKKKSAQASNDRKGVNWN